MSVKWLECNVQHNPEALENKRYHCTIIDYRGKPITLKIGGEYMYVDYSGPPGAPYICPGQIKVELYELLGERSVILLPVNASHDEKTLYVKSKQLSFSPPEILKTSCLLRRMK
jgi:hypothetical protein